MSGATGRQWSRCQHQGEPLPLTCAVIVWFISERFVQLSLFITVEKNKDNKEKSIGCGLCVGKKCLLGNGTLVKVSGPFYLFYKLSPVEPVKMWYLHVKIYQNIDLYSSIGLKDVSFANYYCNVSFAD